MFVARSIPELISYRASIDSGQQVAFVPTMGALHAGHRTLITLARSMAEVVVVSIFVNPLQFGPAEDYARYPRPLDHDLQICDQDGVGLVFVPSVEDLYPPGRSVSVTAGPVGAAFEGRFRPGHFDGVLTVVAKLFHLVRPQVAIFGQKDAQQLACIRRMVVDLNAGVDIVGAPTVRDADGLAMSSRNAYLSPAERVLARTLFAALSAGAQYSTPTESLSAARSVLAISETDPAFTLDYLALVNPATFAPAPDAFEGEALLILAARVGSTRLIDNMPVTMAGPSASGSAVWARSAGTPEYVSGSGVASPPSVGG